MERVKIIPKERSWSELKREFDVPNMDNPLPDTLHVKVDKPENITTVFNKIKTYNGVEDLNYAQDIAKKMQFFNNVVHTITLVVVILVAILTITIINQETFTGINYDNKRTTSIGSNQRNSCNA